MKILLVSTAYWPHPCGGSEHVYYLSKGLRSLGHDVTILTTNYPTLSHSCEPNEIPTIRVGRALMLTINQGTSPFSIGFEIPFKVRQILIQKNYDIIHMHSCYPLELGFWTLIFSHTTNVLTPHTVGFKRNIAFNIGSLLFRKYIKKIHGRIYVSNLARIWNEPYYPGDYRVIPNGVDTERFSLSVEPFARESDKFILLYVSRLDQKKGIWVLLEAFLKLKDTFPNLILYIVGKGPLLEKARQYVKENRLENRCTFFGYVPREDVPRFYRTCDIYIAPTLGGEAQGIVLLEAMACAAPVIASNIGGYDEVIEDGKTGLLFTPNSADDLATKITQLIKDNNLRKTLANNGHLQAQQYAWPKITKQIEDYYYYLIKKH
ncbi:MAG: glycosyltransferase family 4 protein [candidate division WOR-3 bacterium]